LGGDILFRRPGLNLRGFGGQNNSERGFLRELNIVYKKKAKGVPLHAMKALGERGGIAAPH
jgi:hypothetical protein